MNYENKKDSDAFKILKQFLYEEGWEPEIIEDKKACRLNCNLENISVVLYTRILSDLDQFIVYVTSSISVPKEQLNIAAEYLHRVNYGLRVASFEMNYEDGEVRCKGCIDFEGDVLSKIYIRNIIYLVLKTADYYFPGLAIVLQELKTIDEVIAELQA
ncbi:MAG: YbjN domain-containing protein [Symploca sp. SIO2E6]|nr:YbjN domain-containing protein [Symploca sp. SIO2E6]